MEEYNKVFQNTFLCKGLTQVEFQYFLSKAHVQVRKYKKNEYIFREMEKPKYDLNAIAKTDSTVIIMDSQIFGMPEDEVPTAYYKITKNLLTMFARKAYILNSKIQMLNSGSLRQRIVRYLMNCEQKDDVVMLAVNREEMADFLNTTRPSLSRELGNMSKEGLIEIQGKKVVLLDRDGLDDCL